MAGFQLRVEQRRGALAIDRTSLSPLRAGHGQGRIGRPLWPYPQRDASCCLHVACASRGVSLGSRCVSHFYLACCTFCVAFLRALGSDSKGSAAWRLAFIHAPLVARPTYADRSLPYRFVVAHRRSKWRRRSHRAHKAARQRRAQAVEPTGRERASAEARLPTPSHCCDRSSARRYRTGKGCARADRNMQGY